MRNNVGWSEGASLGEAQGLGTVGKYDSRLTNARFLGDVTVSVHDGVVDLTGYRVSRGLFKFRLVTQWVLGAVAVIGILTGAPYAWTLLSIAFGFSFVMYLAMWWAAPRTTLTVDQGAIRDADIGWVWVPQDALFMGSAIAASSLAGASARTVSFRVPDQDAKQMLVVLHADEPRQAARLVEAIDPSGV